MIPISIFMFSIIGLFIISFITRDIAYTGHRYDFLQNLANYRKQLAELNLEDLKILPDDKTLELRKDIHAIINIVPEENIDRLLMKQWLELCEETLQKTKTLLKNSRGRISANNFNF